MHGCAAVYQPVHQHEAEALSQVDRGRLTALSVGPWPSPDHFKSAVGRVRGDSDIHPHRAGCPRGREITASGGLAQTRKIGPSSVRPRARTTVRHRETLRQSKCCLFAGQHPDLLLASVRRPDRESRARGFESPTSTKVSTAKPPTDPSSVPVCPSRATSLAGEQDIQRSGQGLHPAPLCRAGSGSRRQRRSARADP